MIVDRIIVGLCVLVLAVGVASDLVDKADTEQPAHQFAGQTNGKAHHG